MIYLQSNPKSGDSTHATRRQWIDSLGKVDRGQGEKNREEHSVKDVVAALESDAFSETQYTKANGEAHTAEVR